MSAKTTTPSQSEISDLINYLRSLDAEKLRRAVGMSAPEPTAIPAGFFGFVQSQPAPVKPEPFGTPMFAVLPRL